MADLSPEARAEIQAAIAIARSDGLHIHKTYPGFLKAQEEAAKNAPPAPEGGPPPVKDDPEPEYDEVATLWGRKKIKKAKDASPAT
jgi:hypothetical protein